MSSKRSYNRSDPGGAMTEIAQHIDLDASPQQVWHVLSDFGALCTWAPNVDDSGLTGDQTEGVGTTRRVRAGRVTVTERVTHWEPPRRLSYEIEGLPMVKSGSNTWTVEQNGSGSRVWLTSRIDTGSSLPQRLVGKVFARGMANGSAKILKGLERRLS